MKRIAVKALMVAVVALAAIAAQAQTTCPVAQLTSPAPGSTLPGSTVTFSWCNASADYFLTVESVLGAHDIFYAVVRVTSVTLINLPTNGGNVFVTLWTQINGNWQSPFSYTFKAASAPGTPTPTPAANYTLGASATAFSLAPGQSVTANITMTPLNGFDGTVGFSCAGLPANVTCKFSPAQLVGNGSPAVTVMTVSVAAAAASNHAGSSGLLLAFWSLGAGAFGMVFAGTGSRRRTTLWLLLTCVLLTLVVATACGGGAASAPVTQTTPTTPTPQPTNPATPQPANAPQIVSGAVMASATGGLNAAANPDQQFQVRVTLLP